MTEMQQLEQRQQRRDVIRESGRVPLCHDYYEVAPQRVVSPGMVHCRAIGGKVVVVPSDHVLTAMTHHGAEMDWEYIHGPAVVEFME